MNQTDDLKVFISNRDSTCDECHEKLGRQAWILLAGESDAPIKLRLTHSFYSARGRLELRSKEA